jgi:hypothetical protein
MQHANSNEAKKSAHKLESATEGEFLNIPSGVASTSNEHHRLPLCELERAHLTERMHHFFTTLLLPAVFFFCEETTSCI